MRRFLHRGKSQSYHLASVYIPYVQRLQMNNYGLQETCKDIFFTSGNVLEKFEPIIKM